VPKTSRHPEVNQERATRLEPYNQILSAPLHGPDTFALELGGGDRGVEGTDEPRVADLDALETSARQNRGKADADHLDFRELGHNRSVAPASG
jgi:hypothetical protein